MSSIHCYCTTIIGENVRNKYDISRDDWNSSINIIYNKIDLYRDVLICQYYVVLLERQNKDIIYIYIYIYILNIVEYSVLLLSLRF